MNASQMVLSLVLATMVFSVALELRLDEGPLGEAEAEKRLRAWAKDRDLA